MNLVWSTISKTATHFYEEHTEFTFRDSNSPSSHAPALLASILYPRVGKAAEIKAGFQDTPSGKELCASLDLYLTMLASFSLWPNLIEWEWQGFKSKLMNKV